MMPRKPDWCPLCSEPNPFIIGKRSHPTLGEIELRRCQRSGSPKCVKRWWRYTLPDGRVIEGGSARGDDGLFEQAVRQIPKKVEEVRKAEMRMDDLKESIVHRLGTVDNEDTRAILGLFKPTYYEFSDWEIGFIKGIVVPLQNQQFLTAKQLGVIKELTEKVQRGF